jgi:hypothetical protein
MAQDRSSGDSADKATVRVDIGKRRYAAIGRYVEVSRSRGFWVGGKGGDGALRIVETHERTASTRDGPPVSGTRSEMVEIGRAWKRERNSSSLSLWRGDSRLAMKGAPSF